MVLHVWINYGSQSVGVCLASDKSVVICCSSYVYSWADVLTVWCRRIIPRWDLVVLALGLLRWDALVQVVTWFIVLWRRSTVSIRFIRTICRRSNSLCSLWCMSLRGQVTTLISGSLCDCYGSLPINLVEIFEHSRHIVCWPGLGSPTTKSVGYPSDGVRSG